MPILRCPLSQLYEDSNVIKTDLFIFYKMFWNIKEMRLLAAIYNNLINHFMDQSVYK